MKAKKMNLGAAQEKAYAKKRMLQRFLDQNKSCNQIAEALGVSKQRVFQLLRRHNLSTPLVQRKSFLKGKPEKYHWLDKMLRTKKVPKEDRLWMLDNILLPDVCPIFGIELNYYGNPDGKPGWARGDDSPSLDQIIPSKGYTPENIQIISWRANRIKNDSTPEELRLLADYMEGREKADPLQGKLYGE